MKISLLSTVIAILFTISAFCQSSSYCISGRFGSTHYFNNNDITSATNVQYGQALDYQNVNTPLYFDIFYPKLNIDPLPKRPFILLIHGGGFTHGTRTPLDNDCEDFALSGYVSATIDYRLGVLQSPQDQYRAIQDARAAMRYFTANASTYGIDTSMMFIGGCSAGAIIANSVQFVQQNEWANSFLTNQGGLESSTNTYTTPYSLKGVACMWGSIPSVSYITPSDAVPVVAFHGEQDNTVPIDPNGSRGIYNKLRNLGICSEINIDPLGGHGSYPDTYWVPHVACFFKNLMCNNCTSVSQYSITASCSANAIATASFNVSSSACVGQTVTPTNLSTAANSYSWTMSGGSTPSSTLQTASTTYSTSGTYSITLLVNGSSSVTKTITVASNPTVTVAGGSSVCSGSSLTLTANGASTYTWMPGGTTTSTTVINPTATTVYTVAGNNGCTATKLKTITVNALPTVIASTSNSVICDGQVVILTASGASNYTLNPGSITTNPASFNPTITTNYTITGAGTNGCKNKVYKTVSVSASACTDIYELKNSRSVSVYPNPVKDVLYVNLKEKQDATEEFVAVLIDDTGKEVYRQLYNEREFTIDTKQFSEGIYIFKIKANQSQYIQKVVIMNH